LVDLCDANEALDVIDEHEEWAHERAEKKARANRGNAR